MIIHMWFMAVRREELVGTRCKCQSIQEKNISMLRIHVSFCEYKRLMMIARVKKNRLRRKTVKRC